jgi:hypothetical protein
MSTPGTARAQSIRYKKTVCFGLAKQAINFASAASLGHRVLVSIPVDYMNEYFTWSRASGSASPVGHFTNAPSGVPTFNASLVAAFQGDHTDLDGVAKGLNFSSSALDTENNIKRNTSGAVNPAPAGGYNSANDLVMAYLMFKCFGSSAYDPTDFIYNLADAFGMLTNAQLSSAIQDSLDAEEDLASASPVDLNKKGEVDAMFRAFLAADPMRYFVDGQQIPGLFETNADVAGSGNWCLTVGDKIEIPLQLVFTAPVTVLSVQDNVQNPSSSTPDEVFTTVIQGDDRYDPTLATPRSVVPETKENVIAIRLQIVCSAPSAGTDTGSTAGSANLPLDFAATANAIFYTPTSYGEQTAIVAMAMGGTPVYTYAIEAVSPATSADLAGLTMLGGVLKFVPSAVAPSLDARAGRTISVKVTVTDAATPTAGTKSTGPDAKPKHIKVTFDSGKEA